MKCIAYRDDYKYQLDEAYEILTVIKPKTAVDIAFLSLSLEGLLTVKQGYAWDGPSGPTFDTLNFMRGSLVHDAFYQLMREEFLDHRRWREPADRLLQKMCREDGMTWLRAQWVYRGVRLGGGPFVDPANARPVIRAPKSCQ
jgi:hypothetical protein